MWKLFPFRRGNRSAQRKSKYRKPRPRVPVFEQLEKRWLMTVNLQMFNLPMASEAASTGTMLLASFSYDAGSFSQYTVNVNFGDNGPGGYSAQAGSQCGTGLIYGYHTYPQYGAYTVQITVNGPGGSATGQVGIMVLDAPISGTGTTFPGGTGQTFQNIANYTETGPNTVLANWGKQESTIDYGDGTLDIPVTATTNGALNGQNVGYPFPGSYAVTVRQVDEGGASAYAYSTATVATGAFTGGSGDNPPNDPEVDPTLVDRSVRGQGQVLTVQEGTALNNAALATFTVGGQAPNAGQFNVQINWGDGSATTNGQINGGTVSGTHTYTESGTYPITLSFYDTTLPAQLNPTTAIQAWATVTDAPISLQAMTISGNSGQQLNNVLLATFTDPNVNETSGEYIAWVNWGDSVVGGQMLPPGSVSGNNGNFQVRGNSHTYAHGGTYKTVITIFDGSNPEPSEVQAVGTANISPASPTSGPLTGTPVPIATIEGTFTGDIVVASFTDSNSNDTGLNATINWGDGTTTAGTIQSAGGNNYNVLGCHTYAEASYNHYYSSALYGGLETTVTVSNASHNSITIYSTATITDPPLTASSVPIIASGSTPLVNVPVATFTDPNLSALDTSFKVKIYWGNGTTDSTQTAGTVIGSHGSFTVVGNNVYGSAPGTYVIMVDIMDDDISRAVVYDTIYVLNGSAARGIVYEPLDFWHDAANTGEQLYDIVNYGDGSAIKHFGSFTTDRWGSVYHIYPAAGSYSLVDNVYDDENAVVGIATVPITVNRDIPGIITTPTGSMQGDPPGPYIHPDGAGLVGMVGQALCLSGSDNKEDNAVPLAVFTDWDPTAGVGQFEATISWGDGTSSPGAIKQAFGNGPFSVWGEHTYDAPGTFRIVITIGDAKSGQAYTAAGTNALIQQPPTLPIYQRMPGTRLEIGTDAAADGGQATVAPNTGALQVYQPLDFRLSHDSSHDAFIDVNGNPLQGNISGDDRLLNQPAGASAGINAFSALVYSSDTVSVRPIAEIWASFPASMGVPCDIQLQLTFSNRPPQPWITYTVPTGSYPGEAFAIGDQVALPVIGSGAYPWTVTAIGDFDGTTVTQTYSGTALVVANDGSPFGAGWTLDGLNQLFPASNGVMIEYGSGAAPRFFKLNPCTNTYISPPDDFGTLVKHGDGSFTYTSKYGIQWNYGSGGLMNSIVDTHGLTATVVWNGGALQGIDWPDGSVTTFAPQSCGCGMQINMSGNRTMLLDIDDNTNQTTQITDVDGSIRFFGYDPVGHMEVMQWGAGAGTPYFFETFGFDSHGVLRGWQLGDVPPSTSTWQLNPENIMPLQLLATPVTSLDALVTDPRNFVTTQMLDILGWITQDTTPDPLASPLYWERDITEQVDVFSDQNSSATRYFYGNGSGDLIQINYPEPYQETFQYGVFDRRTQFVDRDTHATNYGLNTSGDVTTISDALGEVTTQVWSPSWLLTQVIDPLGNPTNYLFNTNRQMTLMTDALLNPTAYSFDPSGYLSTTTDPRTFTTTTVNDLRGRMTSQLDPDGGMITVTYDPVGHVLTRTDPDGNPPWMYAYDDRGWQTTVTDPAQDVTTTLYDLAGNATAVIDPNGFTTGYAFDSVNRATTTTDPLTNVTTTIYDPVGNVAAEINPDHFTTSNTYDRLYRRLQVLDGAGITTQTRYDGVGNVIAAVDGRTKETDYYFDPVNRQTMVIDGDRFPTTTLYDAAGNVTQEIDARGHTTHRYYDLDNRQTMVQDDDNFPSETAYDANGNTTQTTDNDGFVTTVLFDSMNRSTETIDAETYISSTVYDRDGNVLAEFDNLGKSTSFAYDRDSRKTGETDRDTNLTQTFYDRDGNVTKTIDPLLKSTLYYYDKDDRQTAVVDPDTITTQTRYDPAGNVTATLDGMPIPQTTRFFYDGDGRRIEEIDPAGISTLTSYDGDSNVIAEVDGRGNTMTYAFDADNRMTAQSDDDRITTYTQFDPDGNVTAQVDGKGKTTSYAFDADNRQTLMIDRDNNVTTTLYDKDGNVTVQTDGLGRSTLSAYDKDGRQTQEIDRDGITTYTFYDKDGRVTETINGDAKSTFYAYDPDGQQTLVTEPDGILATTQYDADGRVTLTIDGRGLPTAYAYDNDGRQTSVTDAETNVTTTQYDADGNAILVIDARTGHTTYAYDADPRQTMMIDPAGITTYTRYDNDGNVIAAIDGRGHTTSYGFDANGWQTSVTDRDGHITASAYDLDGNVTATASGRGYTTYYSYDPDGNQTSQLDPNTIVTSMQYDADGRVTASVDGRGKSTRYAYDPDGRQTSITDQDTHTTTMLYDSAGQQTAEIDPDGNTTLFSYDDAGRKTMSVDLQQNPHTTAIWSYDKDSNVTATTDRDGRTRTMSYDLDNRLTQEIWRDSHGTSVNTLMYSYDQVGNQLMAGDNNAAYYFQYDPDNRVTVEQASTFGALFTFQYDPDGNRTLVLDNFGGVTTSIYDFENNLLSRQFGGTGQTPLRLDLTWNADNQVSTMTRYSDLAGTQLVGSTVNQYDPGDRLTLIQDQNPSNSTIASFASAYDPANRVTQEIDNGTTYSYAYDDAGQLTQETDGGNPAINYGSYDAAGNRTMTGYALKTTGDNQYSTDGAWNFTLYDKEGNLSIKVNVAGTQSWTYAYDNLNRLIQAQHWNSPNQATGTLDLELDYTYDVFGNRVTQNVWVPNTSTQTHFLYDQSGNALADLSNSNALQTRRFYLDGVDQLFARIAAGAAAWYLTDRLGSVRALTDNTGAVQDQLSFDGYGNILSESNATFGDRYKWTAREFDSSTGLQYNRARYYDPKDGRWLSQDPKGFDAGDANLYRYVQNDPTNATDSSGNYIVATNDKAGDNILKWLGNSGINVTEYPLPSGQWLVYVPWDQREKFAELTSQQGDWGRSVGQSVAALRYVSVDENWTAKDINPSNDLRYKITAAVAQARGAEFNGTAPSALKDAWTVTKAFGEGVSDGAVIMADSATGGSIQSLHAEAEKRAESYDPVTVNIIKASGVVAREALVTAATAGASNLATRGATSLVEKGVGALAPQVACKVRTGINAGMAGYQAYSTVKQAAELANEIGSAYDILLAYKRGEAKIEDVAGALSKAGINALSTADSVRSLANLAGRLGKEGFMGVFGACFAAGTLLLTPNGEKAIEEFKPGDLVLSRCQSDVRGPIEAKLVQQVFGRTGRVLHLHVAGAVIRTTPEHPVYACGKGWVAAGNLTVGDLLSSHDGQWLPVEDLFDTGEYEAVYNLCIADYHTYFVCGFPEGVSVWAHNADALSCNAGAPQESAKNKARAKADAKREMAREDSLLSDHDAEFYGGEGVVYEVPGSGTPSGLPYVGRTKQGLEKRAATTNDGRDRSKATVIGRYPESNEVAGRAAEQAGMDDRGGIVNLDNRRNEVAR